MLDSSVLYLDMPIMLGFTLAMLLMAIPRKGKAVIQKSQGILLTSLFIAFLILLYFRSTAV